ncbi:ParA family protein [Orbus mooreae]|uniref:ParA family protein n=1 Tax=Orbus mooreae TaxID=3074107 RepID=UPI00370DA761
MITIADTKVGSTKSTTVVNVAAFSTYSGLKTLLLDFDLEHQQPVRTFHCKMKYLSV